MLQRVVLMLFWLAAGRVEAFSSPSRPTTTPFVGVRPGFNPLHATLVDPVLAWNSQKRDDDTALQDPEADNYDKRLLIAFAIPPVLAFVMWGQISHLVAYLTDLMGFPGQNVDGNAFANNLLRPTINGVVVPASGIGLGTLFATTVNVLWNRQLMLQTKINTEVCELRHLRRAIFGCFGTAQHSKRRQTALSLVLSYTRALMAETAVGSIDRLEEIQATHGIAKNELDELAEMMHGVDGAAVARQSSVSKVQDLLVSLNAHRSGRVATTLQRFPIIHWSVLSVLYSIIVLSFLLDSNQEVNQYLNSAELRVLFATIVMVGSGAAMLLRDLEDPFQGSFCINSSSQQLESLEELLMEDIREAEDHANQAGPTLLWLDQKNRERPNYNTGNTVYLHLLTGPLAANIRMLGDAFSWTWRKLYKGWTLIRNMAWRRPKKESRKETKLKK